MGEEHSTIELRVCDSAGQPLVARALLFSEGWRFSRAAFTDAAGCATFSDIPPQPLSLEVDRGPLWSRYIGALDVRPGERISRRVVLERLCDPRLYGYYPGDPHVHSLYSDGRQTPQEIAHAARAADLSWCALTDHDTMDGAQEWLACADEAFLPIVGEEVSTGAGHILVLGASGEVRGADNADEEQMQRIFAEARALGGAVFVAHPNFPVPELSFRFWNTEGFHGLEVVHQGSLPPMPPAPAQPDLQAEELFFELLEQGRRLAPLAGSDCHDTTNELQREGLRDPRAALSRIPEYVAVLEAVGLARMKLWARQGNAVGTQRTYARAHALSREEILAALVAGRTVVSNGPFLLVESAAGQGPGDVIRGEGSELVFFLRAWFNRPLRHVSVRAGREVVRRVALGGRVSAEVEVTLPAETCRGRPLLFQLYADEPYSALAAPIYVE